MIPAGCCGVLLTAKRGCFATCERPARQEAGKKREFHGFEVCSGRDFGCCRFSVKRQNENCALVCLQAIAHG